ncbi:MAG: dicarboxylate/amino acid:cation symporter [Gemmatimonadaceae bacterium]|nr:dicarboxylate/amino acid:cation symporter [Gemmatimonadaceae bacterium]
MFRSQSVRVLLALAVGLAAGMTLQWRLPAAVASVLPAADVVGTLWTNAIRMTVIPLVFALTIGAVAAGGGSAELRRAGTRAVVVFVVLLLAGGVLALVTAEFAFAGYALPAEVAERLRGSAGAAAAAPAMPSLAQRLLDMVPANPMKAAVDGALLPVVVFALALGFALKQVPAERRAPVVEAARGVADALLVLVGWVVAAAPVGVLALALALGARLGASSVGALARYIATLSMTLLLFTALLYPVVVFVGRVGFQRFLAAAAPAQALAAGTRSSLAALPVMISAARARLGLSEAASGFVLPLAVSIFRVNVPMAWVVGAVFLGKLYGIPVGEGALAGLVVTATLLSFSVPGIPSASLFLLAPVLVELGLPAEGVGILIAVDVLPDMFKTLANVTSQLTAAAIAGGPAAAHAALTPTET